MIKLEELLPADRAAARLLGRLYDPAVGGPCLVLVQGDEVVDVTSAGPTMSRLLARPDLFDALQLAQADARRWPIRHLLESFGKPADPNALRLLAPVDLQVIKAAGVTFVESMLERVVEERAGGDPNGALQIRAELVEIIGGAISEIKPGSDQAAAVKAALVRDGLWSAYLEVGIGPDPEVFTKAPVLAAVGAGAEIGVRSTSKWNNPEPEIVLLVDAQGRIVGVTLGNDVNLRDIEGRSALLLGEAKDNNASCALGPFIRLLDEHFTLDDVRSLDVNLRVEGPEGFVMDGFSSMRNISRDPAELVTHVIGAHHQYPDGFVLFTGTLFAPTQDRFGDGHGFTHVAGDVVRISTPKLGQLVNVVRASEEAQPWTEGIWSLMSNLHSRNLLTAP